MYNTNTHFMNAFKTWALLLLILHWLHVTVFECKSMCKCSKEPEPVCGEDGNTYHNKCEAACKKVDVLRIGNCKDNPDCKCDKPDEIDPVCGEDGKSYKNSCQSKCADVAVKHSGSCETSLYLRCFCPWVDQPVCGTSNRTYRNDCFALCVKDKVQYKSACKSESKFQSVHHSHQGQILGSNNAQIKEDDQPSYKR